VLIWIKRRTWNMVPSWLLNVRQWILSAQANMNRHDMNNGQGETKTLSVGDLGNNLLLALSEADRDLLYPSLRIIHSDPNHILYKPGQNVELVYFPRGATLISFVIDLEDGDSVEAIQVGREGAVGGIVSHGLLPAFSRIMVQNKGELLTLPISKLEQFKEVSRSIERLFNRYADCLVAQMFQSTACNAVHTLDQRLAKWMVASAERTGSNEITLTQDRLAAMLGVGRTYVNRAMRGMEQRGIIKLQRGRAEITNVPALQAMSCNCNESVKEHFRTVLSGVYPPDIAP
jgi:Crp-like helix-turn-helix domain